MDLARHYFISADLDDLENVEKELEREGISTPQIHVLSRDSQSLHLHKHLHGVPSILKRDMFHSGFKGAIVGTLLAPASLVIAFMAGWTNSAAGWMPFIFLAVLLFGFSMWLGGMHGLHKPNHHFKRFQKLLDQGKHVLFIDIEHDQYPVLQRVCESHPGLESAGTGEAVNSWVFRFAKKTNHWWYWRIWRNA